MSVLSTAGGILLAIFILFVIAVIIAGVMSYREDQQTEEEKRMSFDANYDGILDKTENWLYWADRKGIDTTEGTNQFIFYMAYGCTAEGSNNRSAQEGAVIRQNL